MVGLCVDAVNREHLTRQNSLMISLYCWNSLRSMSMYVHKIQFKRLNWTRARVWNHDVYTERFRKMICKSGPLDSQFVFTIWHSNRREPVVVVLFIFFFEKKPISSVNIWYICVCVDVCMCECASANYRRRFYWFVAYVTFESHLLSLTFQPNCNQFSHYLLPFGWYMIRLCVLTRKCDLTPNLLEC